MNGGIILYVVCFYAESNPALKELVEIGECGVKIKFAKLLSHACKKLEDQKVSPDEFRTFAVAAFHLSALQNLSSVREMFDVITLGNGWSYKSYHKLKKILQNWDITDSETQKMLDDYSQLLHSFNVTTSIVDLINKKNLDERDFIMTNSVPFPDYSKLSVKLYPYKVTDKTLQDVKQLWEDIARNLQMPDLDAVLCGVKEGCVLISWLILASEEMKYLIRRRVSCCEEFFRRWNIVQFMLNDECIYQEQVCIVMYLFLERRGIY